MLFEGTVRLGAGVVVEAFSRVRDANVGAGTVIHSHCVVEAGEIGEDCEIGPYARVRPGVKFAAGVKLGNFVENKKAMVGRHSKVNHLTYIGDATIGDDVNVGAGTITCNYDGANKHRTVIGDMAFIGSGVELVAPVAIGAGATIGAGPRSPRTLPQASSPLRAAGRPSTAAGAGRSSSDCFSAALKKTREYCVLP